jgi:hypothetical protein
MKKSDFRRMPKQERSRKRHEEILETTANLFSEKEFDEITTNEIASSKLIDARKRHDRSRSGGI